MHRIDVACFSMSCTWSVCLCALGTWVSSAKMDELIRLPLLGAGSCGNHTLYVDTLWHNRIERFVHGSDALLRHITLNICYYYLLASLQAMAR